MLAVAAVAVFGLGVYLYVAVNSPTDAVANVRPRSPGEAVTAEVPAPEPDSAPATKPERQGRKSTIESGSRDSVAVTEPPPRPGANIDIKKDELMSSANKAYDEGEFDEAIVIAKKVLTEDPANVRMLRIMVSSSCINDDAETARKNYLLLAANGNDRSDMRRRCERYGITFPEQ